MLILNKEDYDKLEHGFFKPDYDEVLPALQAQFNHLASMSEEEMGEVVLKLYCDNCSYISCPDTGGVCEEAEALKNQICALIVAQKEEAVKKERERIEESFYEFGKSEVAKRNGDFYMIPIEKWHKLKEE